MPLEICSDLTPAAWIKDSETPWWQLATFGPSGFAAYARLAGHTQTPDDGYFCLWEGLPVGRLGHVGTLLSSPRVTIPAGAATPLRAYFLFRRPASQVGEWDVPWRDRAGAFGREPALIWPADHTWCVANDVDPNWAGLGASQPIIEDLLADPRLDIARADP